MTPALRILAALALALLLTCTVAGAAQNPFTGAGGKRGGQDEALRGPAFVSPVLNELAARQAQIRSRLTGFAKDIKDRPLGRSFWMFLALSFAYGALHALGPGHGKAFAVSYFMSRPGSLRSGLALGNLTMAVHVLSATILVLAGYLLLHGSGAMTAEAARGVLEMASYALLSAMGLFLAARAVLAARKQNAPYTATDRGHHGSLVLTALFAGIVPCPGASLVLAYAVSQNVIWAGLAAMLAVSLGMGLTTSGFALAAIGSRGALLTVMQQRGRLLELTTLALSLGGALAMTTLGALLFAGRLA